MTVHAKEVETVDAEFTEIEALELEGRSDAAELEGRTEVDEKSVAVKCAISVGMSEAGDIFFNVDGSDQNLLLMEGLLKYAERHMERVWKERLAEAKA